MIHRHLLAAGAIILAGTIAAQAQNSEEERDKALAELRPYQHEFIVKELGLSREQANEFLPVYDKMDSELRQINTECRDLEAKTTADKDATDTELEAAAAMLYSQKTREGEVEQQYYDKFRAILTPRQLLCLKGAERRFTQQLLRHHRRIAHRARKAADQSK